MPPELIGRFVDSFEHRHVIDPARWHSAHDNESFLYHICSVHPDQRFLIALNDGSQTYHPNRFSRFEWIVDAGDVWYCQQVYSADSHEQAADTVRFPPAVSGDPGLEGCGEAGGFAWTRLVPDN